MALAAGDDNATAIWAGRTGLCISRITSRLSAASASRGTESVMRVAAPGASALERTLVRAPSSAMIRESPAIPIFAAP